MLSKIKAILSLDNKSFNSNLKDSQNKVNDFGGQLQNIVKGGAFLLLANQVKKLGEELIKITNLSVDISNSSRAFDRLGISIQNLRRNTGGMVDDLTLMHRAIVANNLGLNVRNLGEYFKFATIRASETGESVDYLVNSIVLGLGRQSIKILDNLGISQKRLNDELKKGLEYEEAVVKIIKDELSKTNTTLEDTIKGGERLKSTWQNLLGELSESQFFKDLNDGLIRLTKFLEEIRQIRQITGKSFTIKDGAVGIAQYFSSISPEVRKLVDNISTLEEKIKDTNDVVELEKLKTELKNVRSYLQDIVIGEEEFNNVVKYTNGLEDLLNKKIEKLKSGTDEVVDGFMTIEKITNRINSLKLILNTADSEEEIISLNKELKDLEYELNRLKKIGTIDIGVQAQVIIPPTFTDIFDTDAFDFENVDVGFNPIDIFDSDMFAQDVEDVGKELDNFLNDLNQFEITASEIAYNISGLFGDFLTDAFSGQEDALQNFIAGLGGLMKQYGQLLVAFGFGTEGLKKALESGNGIAAILAGTALIAIGAALSSVKGSISNYSTGSNYSSSNGSYGNTTCPTGDYLDENREIILKIKGNDLVGAFNKNSNRLNNNS